MSSFFFAGRVAGLEHWIRNICYLQHLSMMSLGCVPDFRFPLLYKIFTIKLGGDTEKHTVTRRWVIAAGIFKSHSDNIFLEKNPLQSKIGGTGGNIPYRAIIFHLSDSLTYPVHAIINIASGAFQVVPSEQSAASSSQFWGIVKFKQCLKA